MNELDMQKFTVDAVIAGGGFAQKLSNRFLVGVVDLLVKLPHTEAGVMEVKQRTAPKRPLEFELDVTVPQRKFLRNANKAYMHSGVISFMKDKPGARGLSVAIYTYDEMVQSDWKVCSVDHKPLWAKNIAREPEDTMFDHLNSFFTRYLVKP